MRFVHSADWQIGKVFKQFGAKEEMLRQARLAAIERLGDFARANGATHILVAGDVYDNEAPSPITLRAPIERMKRFPDLQWHLLPGNHDPHRPEGLWDQVLQAAPATVFDAYNVMTDFATHRMRSYRTAFDLLERINAGFQETFPVIDAEVIDAESVRRLPKPQLIDSV